MGSGDDEVDAALEMCQAYYTNHCQREWFEVEQPVHPVMLNGFWLDRTKHELCHVQTTRRNGRADRAPGTGCRL
jgi:hypothetical protein